MKHFYIILLIVAVTVLTGCPEAITPEGFTIEYDCTVHEVEADGMVPQKGTVVEIPVSYALVLTKTSPGVAYQPFLYRAMVDGVEYSHARYPRYSPYNHTDTLSFRVPVPENDSYDTRTVTIEVALHAGLHEDGWQEWRSVYTATQEALDAGSPQRLSGMDSWRVVLLFDSFELSVDLEDNPSARCLKAMLLDGDVTIDMDVANNLIGASGLKSGEALMNSVPLNEIEYTSFDRGDIFMSEVGLLTIQNEKRKKGISGRDTYIGKISDSSLDDLNTICYSEKYCGLDTYPMTIHLVK